MAGQKPSDFPEITQLNAGVKLFTQTTDGDYSFTLGKLIEFLDAQGLTPNISESPGNKIQVLPDGLYVENTERMSNSGYTFQNGDATSDDIGKLMMLSYSGNDKVAVVYTQNNGLSEGIGLGRLIGISGNMVILDGSELQKLKLHNPGNSITEAEIKATSVGIPLKGYDDGLVTPAAPLAAGEIIIGYLTVPAEHGDDVLLKIEQRFNADNAPSTGVSSIIIEMDPPASSIVIQKSQWQALNVDFPTVKLVDNQGFSIDILPEWDQFPNPNQFTIDFGEAIAAKHYIKLTV